MSTPTKPSIVFCHGIWADGSCFSKVILPLQAEGYEVMAAQYGLHSNVEDVAATLPTLGRVHSPAILVGHAVPSRLRPRRHPRRRRRRLNPSPF